MIFAKTTNYTFKKYGDSFNSIDVIPVEYSLTNLHITNKQFNEVYHFDHDIYLSCTSGYALLAVYDENKESFVEYAIHRVCKIISNTYFNFVSITSFSNIELYTLDYPDNCLKPFKTYWYQEVISRINVTEIIGCYNDYRTKGYNYEGRTTQCFEFTYVFSGKLHIIFKNKEIVLNKGQSIIFPPGDTYSKFVNDKACSFLTIVFDMNIDEYNKDLLARKIFNVAFAREINLNFLSQKTHSIYDNSLMVTTTQYIIISMLKSLYVQEDFTKNDNNIFYNEILDEILSYISSEYKNIESVEDLCEKFFFSRSTIQKLFNEQLGVSPKKYIVQYKINKAIEILRSGNVSVNEITRHVGFNDQHYFSRAFKKETGMSPREFKKEIQLRHV